MNLKFLLGILDYKKDSKYYLSSLAHVLCRNTCHFRLVMIKDKYQAKSFELISCVAKEQQNSKIARSYCALKDRLLTLT